MTHFFGKLRLRTQLALAIAGSALAALLLTHLVSSVVDFAATQMLIQTMDSSGREAFDALNAGALPDPEGLRVLWASAAAIDPIIHAIANAALVLVPLASIAVSVGLGFALSTWIARPLEEVGHAAAKIAHGDLDARARVNSPPAGEVAILVQNFNAMAQSLSDADRELTGASAAIAHELRTPLTILRGGLQGMLDGVFGRDPAELAALITQVDQLSRIVEDLRTLTLAETGRLPLRLASIDLAEEAAALSIAAAPRLAEAGLLLKQSLKPARTFADRDRVRQAALALIENARVHAATGGEILIETGEGSEVFLRVLDRGPGLPPDGRQKLFDRFWSFDPDGKPGAGLGLSVARAVAKMHGGEIDASDRPGGGAIFEIRLPPQGLSSARALTA